jgi:hypothetical protein
MSRLATLFVVCSLAVVSFAQFRPQDQNAIDSLPFANNVGNGLNIEECISGVKNIKPILEKYLAASQMPVAHRRSVFLFKKLLARIKNVANTCGIPYHPMQDMPRNPENCDEDIKEVNQVLRSIVYGNDDNFMMASSKMMNLMQDLPEAIADCNDGTPDTEDTVDINGDIDFDAWKPDNIKNLPVNLPEIPADFEDKINQAKGIHEAINNKIQWDDFGKMNGRN